MLFDNILLGYISITHLFKSTFTLQSLYLGNLCVANLANGSAFYLIYYNPY